MADARPPTSGEAPTGALRLALHALAALVTMLLLLRGGRPIAALATWVGLLLFYPSFYGFLANLRCLMRGQRIAYLGFGEERGREAAATAFLGALALVVGLILAAR